MIVGWKVGARGESQPVVQFEDVLVPEAPTQQLEVARKRREAWLWTPLSLAGIAGGVVLMAAIEGGAVSL